MLRIRNGRVGNMGEPASDSRYSINGGHGWRVSPGWRPAGVFARELHTTSDGHLLLATNLISRTVDLVRLRLDPGNGSRLGRPAVRAR